MALLHKSGIDSKMIAGMCTLWMDYRRGKNKYLNYWPMAIPARKWGKNWAQAQKPFENTSQIFGMFLECAALWNWRPTGIHGTI